MQTNSSQVISKYVSQLHILVYMPNIVTCQTCPEAELAPVSPIWSSSTILCTHGKKLLIKMRTILKGLAHKSAFDVSSSFPVKLEMRCVFFNGFLLKTMRRRKRAWRVRSCSVLCKWNICDVRLSHGVVLQCRLNAAFFTG